MVKVLHVISDSNIGGAGRTLITFLKHYNRERFAVYAALPRGSSLLPAIKGLVAECFELDGLAERSLSFAGIRSLLRLIRGVRPDIVHAHAAISARIAARLVPGVRIVYTRHSIFPNRRALTVFPGKLIAGTVNNMLADRIIAVSPAALENIVETGVNPRKVEVIYNGAGAIKTLSDEEKRAVRNDAGIGENDFLCGIFARLTPVKGQAYILDAARILKDTPGIKIAIAGAGESEGMIKERIRREGLSNVAFMGFLREPDKLISALDVQLNASYGTEATSISLLEGMSAGVPAIVSDYGGNPYVITNGENGIVTPQRNGLAIAEAILTLRNDKALRASMSRKAKEIFAERFTAEAMTRGIENLYNLVIG